MLDYWLAAPQPKKPRPRKASLLLPDYTIKFSLYFFLVLVPLGAVAYLALRDIIALLS